MTESERLQKLEAVQMELFAVAVEKRQLENKRKQLKAVVMELAKSGMKKCRACGVEMIGDCFYFDDRYRDCLYPYCRYCKTDINKARAARKAA